MTNSQKLIALLEDDAATRDEVTETLHYNNYVVVSSGSQESFLSKIENLEVDVYLIDLGLPDGNGLDLIRELKERPDCGGIIVLSGRSDDTDKIVGLEIGADDYITKPHNPRELLARVGSLLRRLEKNKTLEQPSTERKDNESIPFGQWVLNTGSRQLFGPENKEVTLTRSEFDLLLLFLKSKNRAISREELISKLRGNDWAGYDRSIDGLVSRLRQKLSNEDSTVEYIKTIHGIGYLFNFNPE
ncbi:response regulator transcription factor [Pseudopelagicola sp. nBUS_19]|uniref:response regulator transcription factor n=1 Tax=unclassified Pseudopelagicola TaxID=2649563 RepID=UPI003EBA09CE